MSYSDPVNRAISLSIADLVRQGFSKESIKPQKSLAVGVATYGACLTIKKPLQDALQGLSNDDLDYLAGLLAEAIAVGGVLWFMDEVDLVSPGNAQISGSKGTGRFNKAMMLAGYDILIAELLMMLWPNMTMYSGITKTAAANKTSDPVVSGMYSSTVKYSK